jgi:hypothetical protein
MSLDSLAGMFSQRTGAQQSMSGSIMNAIIGYIMQNMMQKGLSSFLGGGSDADGLKSALSSLGGGLNRDHALVQHVQQNTGIQDPDQATQYTQHGVNLLNEQANSNPQGLQSLLGNFLGNSGGGSNQQQGKGGLLGDILGG